MENKLDSHLYGNSSHWVAGEEIAQKDQGEDGGRSGLH